MHFFYWNKLFSYKKHLFLIYFYNLDAILSKLLKKNNKKKSQLTFPKIIIAKTNRLLIFVQMLQDWFQKKKKHHYSVTDKQSLQLNHPVGNIRVTRGLYSC